MSSSVDQIKSKLDVVTVISGYIKLEKTGANFKGKCPFHNEKTPSFFVSPDRGSYYCFGCQAKGDIFTFVEQFEGLDFKGALKVLADKAGVTLDNFRPEEKSDKDVLFSAMEQAQFFFEKKFSEHAGAKEYMASRGVTPETIAHFHIGYAPAEWRELYDFLLSKGVSADIMVRAGLIKRKDGASGDMGFYDTFRSRIMFPINDSSGRPVAFSGRIFPNDPNAPKYLNSPETPIFRKSEVLFGLDKAKKDIHARDYSILVEGQMDLVMLHQSGLTNTVASSGTALTEEHLIRLSRLSTRLIMAFDGDSAGFKAIARGAEIALGLGMEVKVAGMPQGTDPADMALKDKEGLLLLVKNSKHLISFILDLTVADIADKRVLARTVVSNVLPFVSRLQSSSEKAYFIKEISAKTGITEEALWEDVRRVPRADGGQSTSQGGTVSQSQTQGVSMDRSDIITRKLISIVLWQRETTVPKVDVADMEKKISDCVGAETFGQHVELYSRDKDSLIFEAESYYNGREDISKDIDELLDNLVEEKYKKRLSELMVTIQKAEVQGDKTESDRLAREYQQVMHDHHTYKQKKT